MTLLRVLLPDVPHAARADAWGLWSDDGRLVQQGVDVPSAWPASTRREAVLAAMRTRLTTLTLPPMPADRVPAAVAYALEDQLAPADDPPRVAVGAQDASDTVEAAIAAGPLVDALARADHGFARIVPEAALPAGEAHWSWYVSAAGGGFVRTPSGAFALDDPAHALPAELAAALAQAAHAGRQPAQVTVRFACDERLLAAWTQASGISFVPGAPWQWLDTTAARFAHAPDWLAARSAPAAARAAGAAWFRPAMALAVAALALHIGGTLVQWAVAHVQAWRAGHALVALAQSAGIADASTAAAAVTALVQRHADTQHRAGRLAPSDALPLLAQAAPALATLPAGSLKAASYGSGAWTLELGRIDANTLGEVDHALARRGVAVLQAPTAGGTRMRMTALP